jgi:3-oxoacyl-(acyl-carrier-protein) synthase
VVIAHGTGTEANDAVEDTVFDAVLAPGVVVTGTKWCVGHTLGASGAVDLIAACELLRRQRPFALHTTEVVDRRFRASYLTRARLEALGGRFPRGLERVLVTSVGFGGMHAAAVVERA